MPTPDALFPSPEAMSRLRERARVADQAAAVARGERAHAIEERDAARAELAEVRRVLAEALGGAHTVPPQSSTTDLALGVVKDLLYARGNAARAHAARRVAEATTARLLGPIPAEAPASAANGSAH